MKPRVIISTFLEFFGAALIAFALLTIAWQIAAIWVGAFCIAAAFAIDRPDTPGGNQ